MSETATQAKVRQVGRRSRNLGEDRMARLITAAAIVARMTDGTATHNSSRPRSSAGGGAAGEAPATMAANTVMMASPTLSFWLKLSSCVVRGRQIVATTKAQRH